MNPRISTILLTMLSVIFLNTSGADAAIKEISFLSSDASTITVEEGSTFDVQVKVNDASIIAGASFTVTYDTNNLELIDTTSTFFGTFISQGIPTEGNTGYVAVDGVEYYSPQVVGPTTTGSMIAAARFDNGSGTEASLFTLTFQATGNSGDYTISAAQSIITNANAGYNSDNPADPNNSLPYFVGIADGDYPTHTVSTINDCTVTVTAAFVDLDGDGIDDNWEIEYSPSAGGAANKLDNFTATGDYDKDGYSDLQEYLNWNENELDSEDGEYLPAVKNAPDGTGYVARRIALPAVNLLLLN